MAAAWKEAAAESWAEDREEQQAQATVEAEHLVAAAEPEAVAAAAAQRGRSLEERGSRVRGAYWVFRRGSNPPGRADLLGPKRRAKLFFCLLRDSVRDWEKAAAGGAPFPVPA